MTEKVLSKNTNLTVKKEEAIGPWRIAWQRFRKNKIAMVGASLFTLIVISVILVPIISPYDLNAFDLNQMKLAPSGKYWLGTDEQGRDVLFRLFKGGQISILVGLMSALFTVVLGALLGGIAGYYGGWIDNLIMRIAEIFTSIPFYPTLFSISAALMWKATSSQKLYLITAFISILSWPGLARMVRGQILSLREQEFMQACEVLGVSDWSRIVKHLIPNTLSYIIVSATLGMASGILLESALSFLGLGVTPPTPTWGNMVERARNANVFRTMPWLWLPPGVMIMLTVVSINLLGEGLRDAFDPKELR